jgi:di/tricarboxylate transporter
MDHWGLALHGKAPHRLDELEPEHVKLYEAVVTADSILEGRSPQFLRRRSGSMLHLLAVARAGESLRTRLRDVRFKAGDVLLMQGDTDSAPDTMAELRLLPLPERGLMLGKPRKVKLAIAIFGAAILASSLGFLPVAVALLAAILAYILTDILPTRDLYAQIDWAVIVLLGAMIPVGEALSMTGATQLVADGIVALTADLPTWMIIALLMIITMTLSDVINNAATALVMAPLSVAIAQTLGASIDPFLMAVAIAASCAFLTPIGHQSNTLVMGPAGYHFGDYWRVGLPLEILILAVAVPLILWVWPV